jgi:hypothetical protein
VEGGGEEGGQYSSGGHRKESGGGAGVRAVTAAALRLGFGGEEGSGGSRVG